MQYQVPTYTIATVFINKAGNLSDSSRIGLINKMVDEFEAIHGNWGPVGTMYFLRDFVKFEKEYQCKSLFLNEIWGLAKPLTPIKIFNIIAIIQVGSAKLNKNSSLKCFKHRR